MASSQSNSRYTPLPRQSEDTERDYSPHEHLLPSMNTMRLPRSYTGSFSPVLLLRIIAAILSLVIFIILVIDGGDEFIAADIFVMSILILDILMVFHHFVSDVFKVTVELRQQPWSRDLVGQKKFKASTYFDYGLSICLLICLIIGNIARDGWRGGAWKGAVVVGYIVVLLQVLMAVPILDNLTLTIKLHESRGKAPLDTKVPEPVDESERGSARRRAAESEERAQSAEDLV